MNRVADRFPEELRHFVTEVKWTYAKTMPQWPHEYIARERVDEELFVQFVNHIRSNGFEGQFYHRRFIYSSVVFCAVSSGIIPSDLTS